MSRTTVGMILLLVANVLLGFVTGRVFFGLFLHNIPPMALSAFSTSAAHMAYLTYGVGLGVLLFGWTMVIVLLSRFFTRSSSSLAKSGS